MNRRLVEKPDVAAAIAKLEANDIYPSDNALLAEIGVGSKATIARLKKEVLADRDAAALFAKEQAEARLVKRIPMPASMTDRIKTAQDSIAELALAFAEAITEERDEAARRQQDVIEARTHRHRQEVKSLRSQVAALEKANAAQAEELAALSAENASLKADLATCQKELAATNTENADLQKRLITALEDRQARSNVYEEIDLGEVPNPPRRKSGPPRRGKKIP